VERVAIVGLSMGATLGAWLAAGHPEVVGLVSINGLFDPALADAQVLIDEQLAAGVEIAPKLGSDVADPDVEESAYDGTPMRALASLLGAVRELRPSLDTIACPVLVVTSRQDHVVPPESSEVLAGAVRGPVERVFLDRSFHVATIDLDRELVAQRTVAFVARATAAAA
jgi:carboxylesterase